MLSILSGCVGLEETSHGSASHVSVDAIFQFNDELPEKFLRDCGLRDEELSYFRSQSGQPIRFYTCFISYSAHDDEFATRLYNAFQAGGIRCWKWDHDARTGKGLWDENDQAI